MTTEATAAGAETSPDFLGMSDDDFLKLNAPGVPAAEAPAAGEETPVATAEQDPPAAVEEVTEESKVEGSDAAAADGAEPVAAPGSETPAAATPANLPADTGKAAEPGKAAAPVASAGADKNAASPGSPQAQEPAQAEAKPIDYKAFHDQMMKPFKANGKTFELKTPEEALRLMQMGVGYGKKIQDMQPHMKTLRMLEKHDLLDEGKLSYLIEINNKNPDAIKKLIKDAGIDPLDLNTGDNVNYRPVNHAVSDKEVAFTSALQDIGSSDAGQETLRHINQTWDDKSKDDLYEEPEILGVIQSQREDGTYAKITTEIDRLKTLGYIPQTTPFLTAYRHVGNMLFPKSPDQQIQTQPAIAPQPQVIAKRAATPKPQAANGAQANAAAPPKGATVRGKPITVNPLAMSDDEFLKQFEGRF
ncbi:hypothetical protein [Mesorhizobium sp. CN2-181]|uniref:hypothetical protein n=1 Tax=Mesorhizobium yinganensis TaxID=3157707 RepID=UPI0032B864D6